MKLRLVLFFALASTLAAGIVHPQPAARYREAAASRDGIGRFYYGREIAQVMGYQGADWLERPDRVAEERPDLLVAALGLRAGMNVADIGAGSGYLSKRLAAPIAPGKVFAVDLQPQMVAMLQALSEQPGTRNIVALTGAVSDVHLPPNSIDLAILVDVYHELSRPYEITRSIIASLKVGGLLVLVEYRGEDPQVPIKPLHKMTIAQMRLEMRQFPLAFERTDERLPVQHIVFFRKI